PPGLRVGVAAEPAGDRVREGIGVCLLRGQLAGRDLLGRPGVVLGQGLAVALGREPVGAAVAHAGDVDNGAVDHAGEERARGPTDVRRRWFAFGGLYSGPSG